MRVGGGNNGIDGTEGARWHEVIGTYLHGPILPKNPWLTDRILVAAARRRGVAIAPAPPDDAFAHRAHAVMLDRVLRQGRKSSGAI
jgi:CobQ-like glutamine amidotransferase family enzyme